MVELRRQAVPAVQRAPRRLRAAVRMPPRAMKAGWTERELIDQAAITRDMKPSSVTSMR
jgi:hypothetical protein